MTHSRRDILRFGALGAIGAASSMSPMQALIQRTAAGLAGNTATDKLITVFLRGGTDWLYGVSPVGDLTYPNVRPSLFVPPTDCVPLSGSTFAMLNNNMRVLAEGPGNPDSAGHAAFVLQCGNANGARSHFTEQQIYESGETPSLPALTLNEEGFLARLVHVASGFPGVIRGASISKEMQQMYRSSNPNRILAHVKSIGDYNFAAVDNDGTPISIGFADRIREALNNHHLSAAPTKDLHKFVDSTGEFILDSEDTIQQLAGYAHQADKFPTSDAEALAAGLPLYGAGYAFAQAAEESLQIALNTSARVMGLELGGLDTHIGQRLGRDVIDPWLSHVVRSIYDCTVNLTDCNVTIMLVSEFGRTSAENNNAGTDHGVGGTMAFFGPKVQGGVYNCHGGGGLGAPWVDLANTLNHPIWPDAQGVVRDFRALYVELLTERFNVGGNRLDVVIPGWSGLATSGNPIFDFQNIIDPS